MMDDTNDENKVTTSRTTSPDSTIEHDVLTTSDEMMDRYSKWWLHDFGCQDTIDYYRNTINKCAKRRIDQCYNDSEIVAYHQIKGANKVLARMATLSGVDEQRYNHKIIAIEYYKRANVRMCSLWKSLDESNSEEMCDPSLFDSGESISLKYYFAYISGMLYVTMLGLLIQCHEYRKAAEMIFELAIQAPDNECRTLYEYGICLLMKYVNADKERSRKRMRSCTDDDDEGKYDEGKDDEGSCQEKSSVEHNSS